MLHLLHKIKMIAARNLFILFIFLCIACHNVTSKTREFRQIDIKLNQVAKKMGTTLETSGGGASIDGVDVPKEQYELRRIVWIDGEIGKGIFIVPNFNKNNFDAPDWDFQIIAWLNDRSNREKGNPFWHKFLLRKVDLKKIEHNIDELLKQSLDSLNAVKKTDLSFDVDDEELF